MPTVTRAATPCLLQCHQHFKHSLPLQPPSTPGLHPLIHFPSTYAVSLKTLGKHMEGLWGGPKIGAGLSAWLPVSFSLPPTPGLLPEDPEENHSLVASDPLLG